jgi:CheY-like chemotaxis protein
VSDISEAPPRVLHVDDDCDWLGDVKEYLQGEEIPDWGRPEVVTAASFSDGLDALEAQRFDLVVLDVRLGAHKKSEVTVDEEEGVKTLNAIQARRFVPIVFFTGLPNIVAALQGPLVRVVEKTAGLPALLEAVGWLFGSRLPAVNRALLRLVEEEQRRYMWDFVANHWGELDEAGDHTAVAYLLARRLGQSLSGPGIQRLAHDLGEAGGTFPTADRIHSAEMYVMPPLETDGAEAGDILHGPIDGRDSWWLLLTPSCDLANNKADYVLVAPATLLTEYPAFVAWETSGSNNQRDKVKELVKHATDGQRDRWLYLPAALDVPDLVVDFQQLTTIPCADLDALARVAALDSPFAEAAVNRFGRYFGRVGTPDLDVEGILQRLRPPSDTKRAKRKKAQAAGP